jgi:hypothetical protein
MMMLPLVMGTTGTTPKTDPIADWFPLADPPAITCGNRTDLFKKQRRHVWVCLGWDARHMGDGSFQDCWVRACARCGRDQYSRTPPLTCADGCGCTIPDDLVR